MKHYDIVLFTNQPSFYKVRQWNEIAKRKHVLMVYSDAVEKDRNNDFVSEKPVFDSLSMPHGLLNSLRFLVTFIRKIHFSRLIVGGWDDWRLRLLPFLSSSKKNAMLCESSIYEFQSHPVKNVVKRILLTRFSTVYPSGKAQGRIFETLGFRGKYRYTGGCGLLNYVVQPAYSHRSEVKTFLYVGRLVEVKNLRMLISVFNRLPTLRLNIVGYGEKEAELKQLAKENVCFLGAVANKQLSSYYQEADVFVLPSMYEPWGLVIEEALNNGTPVIVSDKVGCRDELVTDQTGIVFQANDSKSLENAVLKMTNVTFYNKLRENVCQLDFKERARRQVEVFLED